MEIFIQLAIANHSRVSFQVSNHHLTWNNYNTQSEDYKDIENNGANYWYYVTKFLNWNKNYFIWLAIAKQGGKSFHVSDWILDVKLVRDHSYTFQIYENYGAQILMCIFLHINMNCKITWYHKMHQLHLMIKERPIHSIGNPSWIYLHVFLLGLHSQKHSWRELHHLHYLTFLGYLSITCVFSPLFICLLYTIKLDYY